MANQKKLEKSAKQAYTLAKDAIDEAQKQAKKLDKKAQRKADDLKVELSKAKRSTKSTTKPTASQPGKSAAAAYTPPLPSAPATPDGEISVPYDAVSVVALRDIAGKRGLENYARLSKADLIELLRAH